MVLPKKNIRDINWDKTPRYTKKKKNKKNFKPSRSDDLIDNSIDDLIDNLETFIVSDGIQNPSNHKDYILGQGEKKYWCAYCQQRHHKSHIEVSIKNGVKLGMCESCTARVKTVRPSIIRRLETQMLYDEKSKNKKDAELKTIDIDDDKIYEPTKELISFIDTGLMPNRYITEIGNYLYKGKVKCFFCNSSNISIDFIQAPVGQFDIIHKPVYICEECSEYVQENIQILERHLVSATCFNCQNPYWINEKELMFRINCSLEEYYELESNIQKSYQQTLDDYYCFNCMISNAKELIPLKQNVKCEGCLNTTVMDSTKREGIPEKYHCNNCLYGSDYSIPNPNRNKKKATEWNDGNYFNDINTSPNSDSFKKKMEENFFEEEAPPEEIGSFVYHHKQEKRITKYRYSIFKWAMKPKNNIEHYYYYIIYEMANDSNGYIDHLDLDVLQTKHGVVKQLHDSTQDDGYYPSTIEGMYYVIQDARSYCHNLTEQN